jgi:hypothetical protein
MTNFSRLDRGPHVLLLGALSPESSGADLAWFRAHPRRLYRARPATKAEVRALRRAGITPPRGKRMALAMRCLCSADMLIYEAGAIDPQTDPTELDDAGAEALFEYFLGRVGGSA